MQEGRNISAQIEECVQLHRSLGRTNGVQGKSDRHSSLIVESSAWTQALSFRAARRRAPRAPSVIATFRAGFMIRSAEGVTMLAGNQVALTATMAMQINIARNCAGFARIRLLWHWAGTRLDPRSVSRTRRAGKGTSGGRGASVHRAALAERSEPAPARVRQWTGQGRVRCVSPGESHHSVR